MNEVGLLTIPSRGLVLLIMIVTFIATSCVSVEVRPLTSAPPPARSVTPGKGFGITDNDNGRVVQLAPDTETVRLVLNDDAEWIVRTDSTYLQLEQFGPVVGQGFTANYWLFRIVRTGETAVAAAGKTICRPATSACATTERTFNVRLKIG